MVRNCRETINPFFVGIGDWCGLAGECVGFQGIAKLTAGVWVCVCTRLRVLLNRIVLLYVYTAV